MRNNISNKIYSCIILGCLFFAAAVSVNSDSLNSLALYVAIPIAFLLSFLKRGKFVLNRYEGILLAIYAWDLFSALWAQYPTSASRELHRILGAVLLIYIMAANGVEYKLNKFLYITFIILYIGAWYYSINNSLVILEQNSEMDRLNDEKLNANTMAYYTFYATMSFFLLSDLVSSMLWRRVSRALFLCMIPLSFFVALVTASRQVLIIQFPLIAFLLYERYFREAKLRVRITFIIVSVVAIIVLLPTISNLYENSYLAVRAEKKIYDDSRWFLLKDAISVGFKHFPFGVGAGNYVNYSFNHHFSHCSYTELFANNGIVGLILFCYLIYYFISHQWIYYKRTNDRQFIGFLIFGVIFTFDQLFYVFYTDLWLMSFFVLVATHSESYYNYITTPIRKRLQP